MKHFDYYDYSRCGELKISRMCEDAVNDCGYAERHLSNLESMFSEMKMDFKDFLYSCIGYWSESEQYDDRNRLAVWGSREIAKRFPYVKECKDDVILMNAYAFTISAHRYLQNELFKTLLASDTEIRRWWDANEFVYGSNGMIPYRDYLNGVR